MRIQSHEHQQVAGHLLEGEARPDVPNPGSFGMRRMRVVGDDDVLAFVQRQDVDLVARAPQEFSTVRTASGVPLA